MADNINLREQEYNEIASELKSLHTSQIQAMTDALGKMRELATSQDGLSAEKTSAKIADVVDCISNDVISLVERAFEDSEAGMSDMMSTTMAVDTYLR